jgi:hypothetical protein
MQELFVTLGPILAIAIPAILIGRWIVREVKETREINQQIRCGPGCVCGGENIRARQDIVVYAQQPQQTYQQQPQIIYMQSPPPPLEPQVIYIQAPPQPQYLPSPQDQRQVRYLPAPQTEYQPDPAIYAPQHHPQQAPQSYYPGPAPIVEEYQPDYPQPQPARQVPPAHIQYIPPAPISPRDEVERRLESWQLERELERRRR